MSTYLLDTHYWIWIGTANTQRISPSARKELQKLESEGLLAISDISAWELSRLVLEGDVDLGMSVEQFIEHTFRSGKIKLMPLTTRILIESTRLPGDVHRDPADRMLIATAREMGLTLITRDKNIHGYAKQGYLAVYKP